MAGGGALGAVAALGQLAGELDSRAYAVTLVTGQGDRLYARITSRQAAWLTGDVYCDGRYFWWSWVERIAPVADAEMAAQVISRALQAMAGFPWRVWDLGDTKQPLAEGSEHACRAVAVALAFTHPRLVLEDPGGREWSYRAVSLNNPR